ncbi:MAG: hypothetical protein KAI50_03940 [Desulfobacterales bacterium]|nr:hypothetical protein [Desulfobacterales bacterium]
MKNDNRMSRAFARGLIHDNLDHLAEFKKAVKAFLCKEGYDDAIEIINDVHQTNEIKRLDKIIEEYENK